MRRKAEFLVYFLVILFMIVRYANVDLDEDRRARPDPRRAVPQDPAVLLPDGAALPVPVQRVDVELENELHDSVGTAFAVDSNGTYVTARHVVDGCKALFFTRPRGGYDRVALANSERNRDFAVVKARGATDFHLVLRNVPAGRGTEGYMMGYPQGKPADVRATVLGHSEMRSSGRYRMQEPVIAWVERERRPGFDGSLGGISGGPVFDAVGNVIGTVVAGAPRRGRVYTTHPKVFDETRLVEGSRVGRTPRLAEGINRKNFDQIGNGLRASGAIRQIFCKAS
jgi:S1-C subfamily serine protease